MKPIIQIQPGWIDKPTQKAMREAGYLVVEVPEGQEIKTVVPIMVVPEILVDANEMLVLALEAILRVNIEHNNAGYQKFAEGMAKAARKNFEASKGMTPKDPTA
jgi:hypothetical protein